MDATGDGVRLVRVRAARTLTTAGVAGTALDGSTVALATAELEASLKVWPDDPGSLLGLGNLRMDQGDHAAAAEAFELAVKLDPGGVAPRVNAAMAHALAGRPDLAEARLREALEIAPDDATANLDLGLLLAELGRTTEAAAPLTVAATGGSPVAAYNLCVLTAAEDARQALPWCRLAVEAAPDEPRYRYTLAFYLRQTGDDRRAAAELRALLAAHPDYTDAAVLLAAMGE